MNQDVIYDYPNKGEMRDLEKSREMVSIFLLYTYIQEYQIIENQMICVLSLIKKYPALRVNQKHQIKPLINYLADRITGNYYYLAARDYYVYSGLSESRLIEFEDKCKNKNIIDLLYEGKVLGIDVHVLKKITEYYSLISTDILQGQCFHLVLYNARNSLILLGNIISTVSDEFYFDRFRYSLNKQLADIEGSYIPALESFCDYLKERGDEFSYDSDTHLRKLRRLERQIFGLAKK